MSAATEPRWYSVNNKAKAARMIKALEKVDK